MKIKTAPTPTSTIEAIVFSARKNGLGRLEAERRSTRAEWRKARQFAARWTKAVRHGRALLPTHPALDWTLVGDTATLVVA